MKIIKSATLDTIDAITIDVESTFTKGLPSFTIVGMISTSINESKDSVNYLSLLYFIKVNCIVTHIILNRFILILLSIIKFPKIIPYPFFLKLV